MSFEDMPQGGERTWDAMGYLVAIAYDDEAKAPGMLEAMQELAKEGDLKLEDAVVLVRRPDGKIKIHETVDQQVGRSAGKGALWGVVAGAVLAIPVAGLAVGAGLAALSTKLTDTGISRDFQKRVAERLQPGTSAILLLAEGANREKVLAQAATFGGTLIHTDLSPE